MKEESAIKDLKKQAYFAVAWREQASAHIPRIGREVPWSSRAALLWRGPLLSVSLLPSVDDTTAEYLFLTHAP